MFRTIFAAGVALLLVPAAASAQSVAERFSYSAPSGMFSEGTTKWQMYRFMEEDKERTARLNAGEDLSTGSVQGTAISTDQVRRPGEYGSRRRNTR